MKRFINSRMLVLVTTVVVVALITIVSTSTIRAQDFLAIGDIRMESISPEAPLRVYTFMAAEGDTVTIHAVGAGFMPSLALLDMGGQAIATNSFDAISPANFDARITRRIPASGAYTILIGSADGGAGAFQLSLHSQPLILPALMTREQAFVINIPQGQPRYAYAIEADPFIELRVIVRNLTPEFDFVAMLFDENGRVHGSVEGYLPEVQFVLPPRNTQPLTAYTLHLSSNAVIETGDLCVGVTAGLTISCQPNSGQPVPPQVFPTATPQPPQGFPTATPFVPDPVPTNTPGLVFPTTRPELTPTNFPIIPLPSLQILPTNTPQIIIPLPSLQILPTNTPQIILPPGGLLMPTATPAQFTPRLPGT